ncbi:BV8 family protein [Diolcogaster facetosa bracovirus]|uniref:BV8 family protein n=1 Tax=Bracoviriform facetosae TaxID=2083300 RepID=R9XKS0_9VIRU|nr:BV8 family protein [Diolcogaster facetosa bracovirus] [Bracoviriform facetosae]AGO14466.1 BV8 family protein [Diolcogaster facetosa bracovirus] [Bracoviriform facetosae]
MEELLNYVEVTKNVLVPSRWPLSNIKTLVVTLVRKTLMKIKIETMDAYIYEIVLPKDEANIRRKRISGNSRSNKSWPDYVVSVSTKGNKISYYLMPSHVE